MSRAKARTRIPLTLWVDCFSGISGDMCLGALVDAGASFKLLKEAVDSLALKGVSIRKRSVRRAGIRALKVRVDIDRKAQRPRKLKDVERIISKASLSKEVRSRSLAVFQHIFRAEARVHGGRAEDIHLHEMGAADTLVDVVGTMFCLELLDVLKVISSPVNVGSGSVRTAHGELPVPAPATAELLKGVTVTSGSAEMELTTPTGAAIIKELATSFGPMPLMKLMATGTGAGTREIKDRPNVLRVFIGEGVTGEASNKKQANTEATDSCVLIKQANTEATDSCVSIIETNIDDMTPEALAHAAEGMLLAGALDVFIAPVIMKKGRPGFVLTVLAKPENQRELSELVFRETTTIGVRIHEAARTVLERRIRKVKTKYGVIRIKDSFLHGRLLRSKAEYEDCARASRKFKRPISDIMREAEGSPKKT